MGAWIKRRDLDGTFQISPYYYVQLSSLHMTHHDERIRSEKLREQQYKDDYDRVPNS